MSRRGENIRKRKDGRWEARIKKEDCKDITTKYISVYGKSYKEVKEKKKRLLLKQNEEIVSVEKTLSDVFVLWLENNSIRQKDATRLKYQFIINQHINPVLGDIPISQIDGVVINRFLYNKLQDGRLDHKGGLSSSYLKIISYMLNSVMHYAVEQKYCMPVHISLNTPKIPKKDMIILEKKDQLLLEDSILQDCTLTGLGILLSLNAGLRIGEVCALKWENIDLCNKLIAVRHTISRVPCTDTEERKTCLVIEEPKTNASMRDIPIPSKLLPVLKQMKEKAISEYVISDKESFISPRTYEYRFHKLLESCQIYRINYHALRHTFATRCIEVGVDIKTLSEIMGHSNVNITLNTYVHSSMELKRQQMEKLLNIANV